jgi:membrane fusion protein (multidrug efflux system)
MSEGPRRRSAQLVFLASGVGLLVAGFVLLASAPEQERTAVVVSGPALREVATHLVQSHSLRPRASFSGVLEARRTVKLFAETDGLVLALGAEELDRVTAGQTLVRIDPVLARLELERGLAAVDRCESELALAESNLARRRELAARQVLSDAVLDDAENRQRVAAAALREAKARVRSTREDLDNKTVRVPFGGEIRSLLIEAGEYVRVGQVLGELVDLSKTRVTVGVADRELVAIRPGLAVELSVEAWASEVFPGRVLRVGSSADPETRRFPVEIEVDNPDGRLLPGMVGSVAIDLGEPMARTLVPREATLEEFGLRFVWVIESIEGTSVARRRRVVVRPIPFRPGDFEVLEGLEAGETIAVTGVRELRDGESVKRKDPIRAAAPAEGPV